MWRQCALPRGHTGATWRIRLNECFLQHIRVNSVKGKLISSAIFAQLTAECRYTLQWVAPFPSLKITPSHGGYGPHLTHDSWAHLSPQPKWHLDCFSCFCTDDHRVSLYFTMGCPFSPQNCPFLWGYLDPHLIHGSLGPPESSIQVVQPFLQGSLVWQTDRLTDHATRSVTKGCIYIRSANHAA